jgi:hypothetical protein
VPESHSSTVRSSETSPGLSGADKKYEKSEMPDITIRSPRDDVPPPPPPPRRLSDIPAGTDNGPDIVWKWENSSSSGGSKKDKKEEKKEGYDWVWEYKWSCCWCGEHGGMDCEATLDCPGCTHRRCGNCDVAPVKRWKVVS